jgi:hypothetical protein
MLHSIAAWLLAAVFALSVIMFIRSWWIDDQLERVSVNSICSSRQTLSFERHIRLSSSRGRLTLAILKTKTPHPPHAETVEMLPRSPAVVRWHWSHFPDDVPAARKAAQKWERRVVFEYGRVSSRLPPNQTQRILPGGRERADYLVVQWPLVVLLLGLATWLPLRRELQRRKRPWRLLHGYCVECGYDLRKSLGACPECGKGRWGLE